MRFCLKETVHLNMKILSLFTIKKVILSYSFVWHEGMWTLFLCDLSILKIFFKADFEEVMYCKTFFILFFTTMSNIIVILWETTQNWDWSIYIGQLKLYWNWYIKYRETQNHRQEWVSIIQSTNHKIEHNTPHLQSTQIVTTWFIFVYTWNWTVDF